jgi:beta-lactamase class A
MLILLALLGIASCAQADSTLSNSLGDGTFTATVAVATHDENVSITPAVSVTPPATLAATEGPTATPTPTALPVATAAGPFPGEDHCGLLLPVLPAIAPAPTTRLDTSASLEAIPANARAAVEQMLQAPADVALVAFELGNEDGGIFLNGDQPVPLASVVKIIHLVAYAQAVQEGALDPGTRVSLADLEAFYLPNSDLGAHPQALAALREEGLVDESAQTIALEQVPRMMMQYSSNAATDFLHFLLGQERLEQTIIDLGLLTHTAPCPFLGQFLLMGTGDERSTVDALLTEPRQYAQDVMALTSAYSTDPALRDEVGGWRGRWRRPTLETQAYFSNHLNTTAAATDYARLMAAIAENQLGPWEQSVRIRRYLEWPTQFSANQEKLAWLGYKGGSLPGVLTVAYYAQPWDRERPVVAVLFFRNLPLEVYRQWRQTLPHDELARWLLRERDAIPTLHRILGQA